MRRLATRTALAPGNAPVWLTRATQNALAGVDDWTARYAVQYRGVRRSSVPLALIVRGGSARDLDDWTNARKDLLAAVQALGELEGDPSRLAWAQFELARVDQATGDLADARVLAAKRSTCSVASKDPHLDEGEALVAALGPGR